MWLWSRSQAARWSWLPLPSSTKPRPRMSSWWVATWSSSRLLAAKQPVRPPEWCWTRYPRDALLPPPRRWRSWLLWRPGRRNGSGTAGGNRRAVWSQASADAVGISSVTSVPHRWMEGAVHGFVLESVRRTSVLHPGLAGNVIWRRGRGRLQARAGGEFDRGHRFTVRRGPYANMKRDRELSVASAVEASCPRHGQRVDSDHESPGRRGR